MLSLIISNFPFWGGYRNRCCHLVLYLCCPPLVEGYWLGLLSRKLLSRYSATLIFLPVCTFNTQSKVTAARCLKGLISLFLLVHYFPNKCTEIDGAHKYSASPCDRAVAHNLKLCHEKKGYWQIATNAQRFFWEWLLLEGVCCIFQPKPQFFSSVLRELAVLGRNIHVKGNSERWKKIEQSKNTVSKALSYFS